MIFALHSKSYFDSFLSTRNQKEFCFQFNE